MEMFNSDLRLQVYIYDLIQVDTETMAEDDYFPDTKTFVEKYNKMSTPGPVPKHWLIFSCIRSEEYQLDLKFDGK